MTLNDRRSRLKLSQAFPEATNADCRGMLSSLASVVLVSRTWNLELPIRPRGWPVVLGFSMRSRNRSKHLEKRALQSGNLRDVT